MSALATIAKLVLSAALVTLLLYRVDVAELGAALGDLSPGVLAALAASSLGSALVSAQRWRRVLARLGHQESLVAVLSDTLVGSTYNLLLPTSVGGDVVRAVRCGRRIGSSEHAVASVTFERALGLLSLTAMSVLGLAFLPTRELRGLLLGALGLSAVIVLAVALLPWLLRAAGGIRRWGAGAAADWLGRVGAAFGGPLGTASARAETVAWSLLYQVVALAGLVPIGWAWGWPSPWAPVLLGVPVALVAANVPVTLGGHGLRESLFVVVLGPFEVPAAQALGLSLAWLGSSALLAVAGATALALERRGAPRP